MKKLIAIFIGSLLLAVLAKGHHHCAVIGYEWETKPYPRFTFIQARGWVSLWYGEESRKELLQQIQKE